MPIWNHPNIPLIGDYYLVSDDGLVRSLHKGPRGGIVLKQRTTHDGYKRVGLSVPGTGTTRRWFTVHRLVMSAFRGLCPPGKQVNHKDGDKTNNHLWNLEYITARENEQHAMMFGLKAGGAHNGSAKLTDIDVQKIRLSRLSGITIASMYGLHKQTVCRIRQRHIWKHVH